MRLSIAIPWRPQPSRMDALARVTEWYRAALPDAELATVDSPDPLFNLAACRNLAVDSLDDDDDVIVIGDADTLPEIGPLLEAVEAARAGNAVQLPYDEYRWLGAAGTADFVAGTPLDQCRYELVAGACSGVYVTTPRAWRRHGGQDERFRGWGFEDAAWYLAHTTLAGTVPQRHNGRVYALHHQAETRAGEQYDLNATLMERYRSAAGDREAMGQLVEDAVSARRATLGPVS